MTKRIFVSLPVAELAAAVAFYKALGFGQNLEFSSESGACMVWSDSIQVMLITHAQWRVFTQRPFPPAGTASHMLSLTMDSREAVDAVNTIAEANGGKADVNPAEDLGFMYTRDFADPDGHMWAALWMNEGESSVDDAK